MARGAFGPTIPAGWTVVGTTDVNRDGKPDYLLFNPSTRQTAIWFLNNATFIQGTFGPTLSAGWSLTTASDFNGDTKPDYLLFDASTRQTAIWFLNGATFVSGVFGPTLPPDQILPSAWSHPRGGVRISCAAACS
jgi:FG-GAP-like repeat